MPAIAPWGERVISAAIRASNSRGEVSWNIVPQGRVAASGAPPTPDDAAEMARLRGRLATAARLMAVALVVTVILMALAPHI